MASSDTIDLVRARAEAERQRILDHRAGAKAVLDWLAFDARPTLNQTAWTAAEVIDNLFPLPKIPRPRVAHDPSERGVSWRVIDGDLQADLNRLIPRRPEGLP